MIAGLLDSGVHLGASAVRRLMLPDDAGKWVVRIARRFAERTE